MNNRLTGIEKTVRFNYETQPQQHDEEQNQEGIN